MSESKYNAAYQAGYRLGLGDGKHEGLEEGLKRSKDEFWCGFCTALALWPVAGIALMIWRAFR